MSKAYKIKRAHDPASRVPFEIEIDGAVVAFDLPKMSYMTEDQARDVKHAVRDIDKPVHLHDAITDEPLYELNPDGTRKQDDDGNDKPLMGAKQRTVLERTRVTALAMLEHVATPEVFSHLEKLTTGELDDILQHWTEESVKKDEPNLGESSASSTA
jgi:hypothetical protein